MAYSICKIKNETGNEAILKGKLFDVSEIYQIPDNERIAWATNDNVLIAIADETFEIHDSIGAIEGISNQIDWLKGY